MATLGTSRGLRFTEAPLARRADGLRPLFKPDTLDVHWFIALFMSDVGGRFEIASVASVVAMTDGVLAAEVAGVASIADSAFLKLLGRRRGVLTILEPAALSRMYVDSIFLVVW